jgi:hypothetical protein
MNAAYLENLALMDVTHPYNPNGPWPPSGVYIPSATSNPIPQNKNWATLKAPLPKCYDVNINKSASVSGITANPWTYPNGPPVNYAIVVQNAGTAGTLTGSGTLLNWNGILAGDLITAPYGTNPIALTIPSSCPGTWCTPLVPPSSGTANAAFSVAGVANLSAQTSGTWGLTLQPPFTAGTLIKNCASVGPAGTLTGPGYYSNYDPSNPPASQCVQVPVLPTATLGITKTIVNDTGHAVALPPTMSGVSVTCSPYPLLSSGTLPLSVNGVSSLPYGGSVSSAPGSVQNVPVDPNEQCMVTETTVPAVPPGACPGAIAHWDTTITPTQPMSITTAGTMAVTVTNTLRCPGQPTCSATITKHTIPAGGTGFNFSSTWGVLQGFTLNGGQSTTQQVVCGKDYNVFETAKSGWTLTNIACTVTGGTGSFKIVGANANPAFQAGDNEVDLSGLTPGTNLHCTFTNTQPPP